jgi:hypothetical protein
MNTANGRVTGVLDDVNSKLIQEYHIDPLKGRVDKLEDRCSETALKAMAEKVFDAKIKEECFQDKVEKLFNKHLKQEHFLNKVSGIADRQIKAHALSTTVKIALYVGGGFILALCGGLAQKFLDFF